jgi:hypothetical protein
LLMVPTFPSNQVVALDGTTCGNIELF